MTTKGSEFSIFQNAPSIQMENNQQRVEEEEALQDQKRRQEELNNELQNAFEDLEEDEDVDGTGNSTRISNRDTYHNTNHVTKHKFKTENQEQHFSFRDKETHLKNMIDSRNREIEYVTTQLENERKHHKSLIDSFEKRLAIVEAEKERFQMTKDQSHQLLVESKSKNIELEESNGKLQSKIKALESENSNLVGELENTKLKLSDVQIKYNMVEKNVISKDDRNTDNNILKLANERHSAKITIMQQQFDSLKSKCEDLEHEHKNLEIRYKELQRSCDTILIEKSEIINQLNKNLEEAQRQCQNLLSRSDYSEENRHLQNRISSLESQKEKMKETINRLQTRLQDQASDMKLIDSIVQECGRHNDSFIDSSSLIHRDPFKSVKSSIPLAPEARLARVKDELCKSLNNIKIKREEIKIFEKQMREKDEEIKQLKSDENKALVQLNHFRDENIRMESKLKVLEKQLIKAREDSESIQKSKNRSCGCVMDEKYEEKLKKLQAENETLLTDLNSIKAEYETLCMKNGELTENEIELHLKLRQLELLNNYSKIDNELKTEVEKVNLLSEQLTEFRNKIDYVDQSTQTYPEKDIYKSSQDSNVCQMCEEYLSKVDKLQNLCIENAHFSKINELSVLKQELIVSQKKIITLEEKLNLKTLRDDEIEMLKKKSNEFEEYMRSKISSSVASTRQSSLTSNTKNNVSTETDVENDKNQRLIQESRIRDEMAKVFAAESKTMESNFFGKLERLRNNLATMTRDLEEKKKEITVRNEQLELLKFTILQEREEFEKVLKEKDEDFKIAIEKYRNEYENNQQKIEDLIVELKEKEELINEERLSIVNLQRQLSQERSALKHQEGITAENYQKLQLETENAIKQINDKYLLAKRTAMNYKLYSEDKENHFRMECERNKAACELIVDKIRKEAKASLLAKDNSYQDKIKKMETEFDFKLNVVKELLRKNTTYK